MFQTITVFREFTKNEVIVFSLKKTSLMEIYFSLVVTFGYI